jgi:GNAT superfamily N-acetyltransferase
VAAAYRRVGGLVDAFRLLRFLSPVSRFYPGFDEWFVNKVVPGIVVGDDAAFVAEDSGAIVGAAVARSGAAAKLRCVRVAEPWQGRGVALHLIDRALAFAGSDRPLCTAPEEMLHGLARILVNRYGFRLDRVEKGLYRPGRLEYCFNAAGTDPRVKTPY